MAAITRTDVANLANSILKANMNAGISWGTNNYPAGSLAGWFGGTTAGRPENFDINAGTLPAGPVNAAQVVNSLRAYSALFNQIRTVKIIIYYNKKGVLQTQYSGQAKAFTAYPLATAQNVGPGNVIAGYVTYLDYVTQLCNSMWSAFYSQAILGQAAGSGAADNILKLTNTVCHSSCHSSCYGSRSRR